MVGLAGQGGGPDADWLHSATVVTTSANGTMSPIHDRMPVILPQSAWATWLDPQNQDIETLSGCFPAPDTLLDVHAGQHRRQQRAQQGPG